MDRRTVRIRIVRVVEGGEIVAFAVREDGRGDRVGGLGGRTAHGAVEPAVLREGAVELDRRPVGAPRQALAFGKADHPVDGPCVLADRAALGAILGGRRQRGVERANRRFDRGDLARSAVDDGEGRGRRVRARLARAVGRLHGVGHDGLRHPARVAEVRGDVVRDAARHAGATAVTPPGIELHHESLNGRGYPYGLKGDEIPLLPRVIAVADTFDALTTNRPYQRAHDAVEALRIIKNLAGQRLDPKAVNALLAVFQRGEICLQKPATEAMVIDAIVETAMPALTQGMPPDPLIAEITRT